MRVPQQYLGSLLVLTAVLFLWTGQANAAASKAASPKIYYVQMDPLRITNNLKTQHGSDILLAFIQVSSKKTAKTLCAWIPRVVDAFVMVVRSPLQNISFHKKRQKRNINVILKRAAQRVVPPHLVSNVLSFNPYDTKQFKAQRKLKAKLSCKNS